MTRRLGILLALLLAVSVTGLWRWVSAPRQGAGFTHSAASLAALERGDLAGAERELRAAILIEPESGDYHAELGNVYLQQARFSVAAAELEMAAFMVPNRPHVHCQLAQALVDDRRRSEALAALEHAFRKQPECAHALSVQAEQFLRDDNLTQALTLYRNVIRLAPDFALAYEKAGYILLESNQLTEAREILQRGLNLAPQSTGMHALLGEVYSRTADDPQASRLAETHLKLALPANPEAAKLHADLGKLYLRGNDLQAAREEFGKALSEHPYLGEALYGLSRVASRQELRAEAASLSKRYESSQKLERKIGDLKARALAEPGNVALRIKLAHACLASGLLLEAARALDELVRLDPAHREARELRAQVYLTRGLGDQAAREFAIAYRLPRAVTQ